MAPVVDRPARHARRRHMARCRPSRPPLIVGRAKTAFAVTLEDDPMLQLRVARHTERLEEVVGFYRDGIGLTEIGGFRDHDGYDGVFLAVAGTRAHLELTAGGGHGAPE